MPFLINSSLRPALQNSGMGRRKQKGKAKSAQVEETTAAASENDNLAAIDISSAAPTQDLLGALRQSDTNAAGRAISVVSDDVGPTRKNTPIEVVSQTPEKMDPGMETPPTVNRPPRHEEDSETDDDIESHGRAVGQKRGKASTAKLQSPPKPAMNSVSVDQPPSQKQREKKAHPTSEKRQSVVDLSYIAATPNEGVVVIDTQPPAESSNQVKEKKKVAFAPSPAGRAPRPTEASHASCQVSRNHHFTASPIAVELSIFFFLFFCSCDAQPLRDHHCWIPFSFAFSSPLETSAGFLKRP